MRDTGHSYIPSLATTDGELHGTIRRAADSQIFPGRGGAVRALWLKVSLTSCFMICQTAAKSICTTP